MSQPHANENPIATLWRWIGLIQHGILRVFGLFFILFFVLAVPGCIAGIVTAMGGEDEFAMAENGVLKFAPSGIVVEEESRVTPDAALSGIIGGGQPEQVLLRDVVEGLRLAASDDAVQTLLVNFDNLAGATPAASHEIAEEMEAFRAAGKEIIVYGDGFSNGSWFLAAHADEVHMHDYGGALVSGYAAYRTYFRSLLDRFQVTVNVYRVGTFKSALEPFLGDAMSEPAAEANRFLFGDIWNAYTSAAEEARGLSAGALQTYADTAPDLMEAAGGNGSQMALDAGLVDALVGRAAFRDQMIERFGADEEGRNVEGSSFFEYLEANRGNDGNRQGDKIAVIIAAGSIVGGDGDGGVIGGDAHAELVRRARMDDDVRAIVLRIDSGGGSAFASELIREELELAKAEGKIVIASMGGVAASGGYWIATPAHEIWAEPTTITGSIGIFGFIPTFETAAAEYGVFEDGIALTETARGPSAFGGVPESWDRLLQSNIEYGYERFLGIVADSRGMTRDEVDAVAQGRVWTGVQALERNLVDALGGYDEAIAAAAARAGLEEGSYRVEIVKPPLTEFEQFLQNFGLEAEAEALQRTVLGSGLFGDSLIGDAVRGAQVELERFNALNDPNHVYATCLSCESLRTFR